MTSDVYIVQIVQVGGGGPEETIQAAGSYSRIAQEGKAQFCETKINSISIPSNPASEEA